MFRATVYSRAARMLLAATALSGLVAGCSMAGLSGLKPAPAEAKVAMADEAELPPLEPAPVPLMRPETSDAFVPFAFAEAPSRGGSVDGLIAKYASAYEVPESLVRRIVAHESGYNPAARNGPYLGLMQIRHETARTMGYRGPASGLLDADTNLKYAVKYLRGAYLVAGYNTDGAMRYYKRGYYYDAKRLGLLEEAGLR